MGQALLGLSVANPVDNDILCPVISHQVTINNKTSGIDAVCPLAYQDDLHLMEGVGIDRKPIFDKYGRANLSLSGKVASEGNSETHQTNS